MRSKQLSFLPKTELMHGGIRAQGKRKTARPIDPGRPIHLTLKSSRAQGSWSLLHPKHVKVVERRVRESAQKRGIKVYRYVNVGNHLHLLLQTPSRLAFQSFLRELTGTLVMLITGARKGNPTGKFWDHLAWSRVVNWGRDFKAVVRYLVKNLFESVGALTKKRKKEGYELICLEIDRPLRWIRP